MSIKPILFNTEIVRAILDGRKTQTRRVVKEFVGEEILSVRAPDGIEIGKYGRDGWRGELPDRHDGNTYCVEAKPPCKVGDILWVRETFAKISDFTCIDPELGMDDGFVYKADFGRGEQPIWHPSIHMPKEAARIFLLVKDVRVERLQKIDNYGALLEGFDGLDDRLRHGADGTTRISPFDFGVEMFHAGWDRTIKRSDRDKYGWNANPWVWVIKFERCEKPLDM